MPPEGEPLKSPPHVPACPPTRPPGVDPFQPPPFVRNGAQERRTSDFTCLSIPPRAEPTIIDETLLLVKPGAAGRHCDILAALAEAGFTVESSTMAVTAGMCQVLVAGAFEEQEMEAGTSALNQFESGKVREQKERERQERMDAETRMLVSGTVLALLLSREAAVESLRKLCGPRDPVRARATAPESLRARFGTDELSNAVHCSPSSAAAHRDVLAVFGFPPRTMQLRPESAEPQTSSEEEAPPAPGPEERRELLKRARRKLARERRLAEQELRGLVAREGLLNRRLHPGAYGSDLLSELAARARAECAVPLTAEEHWQLFCDLDTERRGWVTKDDFAAMCAATPGLELPGDPTGRDRTARELAQLCAVGTDVLCFEEFSVMLYRIARR